MGLGRKNISEVWQFSLSTSNHYVVLSPTIAFVQCLHSAIDTLPYWEIVNTRWHSWAGILFFISTFQHGHGIKQIRDWLLAIVLMALLLESTCDDHTRSLTVCFDSCSITLTARQRHAFQTSRWRVWGGGGGEHRWDAMLENRDIGILSEYTWWRGGWYDA